MVFVVCEIHGENNAFLIVINLESLGQNKHLTESLKALCPQYPTYLVTAYFTSGKGFLLLSRC